MSPLSANILTAANKALAAQDGVPMTVRVLREYREDARAVAVAVLLALAGTKEQPGMMPWDRDLSDRLLALAGKIEEAAQLAA